MSLYLEHLGKKNPKPVTPAIVRHGNNCYVRLRTDQDDIVLKGNVEEMINQLLPIIIACKPSGIIFDASAQAEPERFSTLHSDDLQGLPVAQKLDLLIRKFLDSADLQDEVRLLMADYKTLIGQEYKPGQPSQAQAANQVDLDLNTVKPHLSAIMEGGKVRRGGKSLIAKLLGGAPAGGFYRNRVEPLVQALEKCA